MSARTSRFPFLVRGDAGLLHQQRVHLRPSFRHICCRNNMLREINLCQWSVWADSVKSILYLAAPPFFAAFRRWPSFCGWCPLFGLVIAALAIAISSFATSVWHLILTQGVLLGLGGCLLYFPIYTFIDQWFVRRKGFAYGMMWAGSGCGGLSGPLVMNWGLSRYGEQTFLRGWSIALVSEAEVLTREPKLTMQLLLIGPLLYFVKPRIPVSYTHQNSQASFAVGFGFLRTRSFWILEFGNVVQGLGYFIPALYLPGNS